MVVEGARLDTGADWRAVGALVCCGGAPEGRALVGFEVASSCWACAAAT